MRSTVIFLRHAALGLCASAAASALLAAQAQDTLPLRDQTYLANTVRLAGVLGAAHGVRVACNGQDDQYWRAHMIELLTLEAPSRGALRTSMVNAFNTEFSETQRRFPYCDENTVAAEKRYAAEGRDLSDRLATYYFARR
ncbi:MAG: TIGR02301 family protein [Pseudomonadota bacterium]